MATEFEKIPLKNIKNIQCLYYKSYMTVLVLWIFTLLNLFLQEEKKGITPR